MELPLILSDRRDVISGEYSEHVYIIGKSCVVMRTKLVFPDVGGITVKHQIFVFPGVGGITVKHQIFQ